MKNIIRTRYYFVLVYSFFPLLFGASIYYLFRSTIWINSGITVFQTDNMNFDKSSMIFWIIDFIIYTMPDAIWSYSLVIFVSAIWIDHGSRKFSWIVFSLFLGTSFEAGQFIGLFKGYFCVNDFIASAIASIFAIKFTLNHFSSLGEKNER